MRIADMNWMQVEERLKTEDRAVLPLGCTEQHAYLSLATDSLLAERVAVEAAEPLGVPVFPVMSYGITPTFMAYPGTVSLRIETFLAVVRDVLDSLAAHGFRRILVVNGHGGNSPARSQVLEWMAAHPGVRVRFHDWWNAPLVMAKVREIDPVASHASWMENFSWTRIAGAAMPDHQKPLVDFSRLHTMGPRETREYLAEGNFGGRFARSDSDLEQLWAVAVAETRALLTNEWGA
jgi:creatinine amidohydrolase